LRDAKVWNSANIKREYHLNKHIETRDGAGSHVETRTGKDENTELHIYYSMDKPTRDCALFEDFPGQLVVALELDLTSISMFRNLLHVPSGSLRAFLVRNGITGGDGKHGENEAPVTDSNDEDSDDQRYAKLQDYTRE
jgi:hypothetical protein